MNMRRFHLFFLLIHLLPALGMSQTDSVTPYLFKQYTDGRIILKGKQVIHTKLNYDTYNQVLFYKNGKQEMYMYKTDNIDTLYIDGRLFIPYQNRLLECYPVAEEDTLLVDWKYKIKHKGVKGPMGTYTQSGGTSSVDMMRLQKKGIDWDRNDYHYQFYHQNTYSYPIGGKRRKFTNLKSFLKHFPKEKKKALKTLAKELKTDFHNPNEIVIYLQHCKN